MPASGATKHQRSFQGCVPCKRKRKKCDQRKPKCTTCVQRNLPCSYDPPTIKLWTPSSTNMRAAAKGSTIASSEGAQPLLQWPLNQEIGAIAVGLIHGNHKHIRFGSGSPDWPGPLAAFNLVDSGSCVDKSPLRAMTEAYATLVLSKAQHDASLYQKSVQIYSTAIQRLSRLLTPSECAVSVEMLCTTYLMAYYELMLPTASPRDCTSQIQGLRVLMESLAPALLRDKRYASILQGARRMIVSPSISVGWQMDYPGRNGVWDLRQFPYQDDAPGTQLDMLLTDTARLSGLTKTFVAQHRDGHGPLFIEEAFSLMRAAHQGLSLYQVWLESLPPELAACTIDADGRDSGHAEQPPKVQRYFCSFGAGLKHMIAQLCRLYLLACLYRIQRWMCALETPPPAADVQWTWQQCQEAADYVASLVPFFRGLEAPATLPAGFHRLQTWEMAAVPAMQIAAALLSVLRLETLSAAQARWFSAMINEFRLSPMEAETYAQLLSKGFLTDEPVVR